MSQVKRLIFAGLCVALGVVLPIALHSVANAGSIFLPMVYWAGLANLHLLAIITPVINAVCAFAGWIPWLVFLLMALAGLWLSLR